MYSAFVTAALTAAVSSVTGRFHCDDDTTGGIGAEMDDELLPNSA